MNATMRSVIAVLALLLVPHHAAAVSRADCQIRTSYRMLAGGPHGSVPDAAERITLARSCGYAIRARVRCPEVNGGELYYYGAWRTRPGARTTARIRLGFSGSSCNTGADQAGFQFSRAHHYLVRCWLPGKTGHGTCRWPHG
jgi:hypothetical protein